VVAAAVALLACCLNPFGPRALLYPLQQLWEIGGSSLYNRPDLGVVEFQSPWSLVEYTANGALVLLQPILFIHLGAALTVLALLLGYRRLEVVDWLLLAAFGFLLWQAEKNFGYFAIAAGPAVVTGLSARTPSRRWAAVAVTAVIVACLVLSLQIRSGWFYAQQRLPHRVGHAFNESFLPVRACAFLNARVPEGRLLNTWDEGGFVAFATGRKTFIDARTEVMGEQFFGSYRRLLDAATLPFELPRWDPQIVLAPLAEVPEWVTLFLASPDWRLVYADEQDFVFLRKGFAPDVAALESPSMQLPDPARMDRALDRAIGLRAPGLLGSLRGPHHDPLIELRGVAAWLYRGRPAAAVGVGIVGLERTTFPAPRLLRNLMLGSTAWGRGPRAALPRRAPARAGGLERSRRQRFVLGTGRAARRVEERRAHAHVTPGLRVHELDESLGAAGGGHGCRERTRRLLLRGVQDARVHHTPGPAERKAKSNPRHPAQHGFHRSTSVALRWTPLRRSTSLAPRPSSGLGPGVSDRCSAPGPARSRPWPSPRGLHVVHVGRHQPVGGVRHLLRQGDGGLETAAARIRRGRGAEGPGAVVEPSRAQRVQVTLIHVVALGSGQRLERGLDGAVGEAGEPEIAHLGRARLLVAVEVEPGGVELHLVASFPGVAALGAAATRKVVVARSAWVSAGQTYSPAPPASTAFLVRVAETSR
jgi:hypothetical protein